MGVACGLFSFACLVITSYKCGVKEMIVGEAAREEGWRGSGREIRGSGSRVDWCRRRAAAWVQVEWRVRGSR